MDDIQKVERFSSNFPTPCKYGPYLAVINVFLPWSC